MPFKQIRYVSAAALFAAATVAFTVTGAKAPLAYGVDALNTAHSQSGVSGVEVAASTNFNNSSSTTQAAKKKKKKKKKAKKKKYPQGSGS